MGLRSAGRDRPHMLHPLLVLPCPGHASQCRHCVRLLGHILPGTPQCPQAPLRALHRT